MFALTFKGRFELKNPDEFLQDMQELLKKHGVEYFGNIQTQNLGEYVDFQKVEDDSIIEEKKDE
jgi:hypothetical protein